MCFGLKSETDVKFAQVKMDTSFLLSLASFMFIMSMLFQEVTSSDAMGPFKMLKEWTKITYDTHCLQSTNGIFYRSSKNEISGIKIYRNRIYLSIPRQDGVPVTLAYISLYGGEFLKEQFQSNKQLATPFPA